MALRGVSVLWTATPTVWCRKKRRGKQVVRAQRRDVQVLNAIVAPAHRAARSKRIRLPLLASKSRFMR